MKTLSRLLPLAVFSAVSIALLPHSTEACSRALWNTNDKAVVVARTMDLFRSDEARLAFFPRGIERDGLPGSAGGLKWTSRYASVAVLSFDQATSDGMNEEGLAAHLLYLDSTAYEKRDDRPGVAYTLWAQYMLDNFRLVKDAIESLKTFQVVPVEILGREWPLHLALEDATGDSAIIEFVDGKPVVHHGREFTVMTNDPTLDEQLANLKRYKLFGGDLAMPGDIDPMSRFVRAASYLKTLPAPKDDIEAVAGIYSVIRSTAVPFGAEDTTGVPSTDTWPTLWFTLADLTERVYYFQSTRSPNLYWLEFEKMKLTAGSPVCKIDANDPAISGEISGILAAHPVKP